MSRRYVPFEDKVALYELGPGLEPVWCFRGDDPGPDLSGILASRDPDHRHNLAIWEPLLTHAPSPARCQPWCCYIATVIFYHRPYVSVPGRPWRAQDGSLHRSGKVFSEYDQIETRLRRDDVVSFDGDHWSVGGGRVVWKHKRWWMRRGARRLPVNKPDSTVFRRFSAPGLENSGYFASGRGGNWKTSGRVG